MSLKSSGRNLEGVEKDRRRVLVGFDAHVVDWMVRLLPSTYQKVVMSFAKNRLL